MFRRFEVSTTLSSSQAQTSDDKMYSFFICPHYIVGEGFSFIFSSKANIEILLGFSSVLLFKLEEPKKDQSADFLFSEPILVTYEVNFIPNEVVLIPDEDPFQKPPEKRNTKRSTGRRHKPDGRIRLLKNVIEQSN